MDIRDDGVLIDLGVILIREFRSKSRKHRYFVVDSSRVVTGPPPPPDQTFIWRITVSMN